MDSKSTERINISHASIERLQRLPGIGPHKARSIVQYREARGSLSSVDDLLNVWGVGPALITELRPLIRVGEDASALDALEVPEPFEAPGGAEAEEPLVVDAPGIVKALKDDVLEAPRDEVRSPTPGRLPAWGEELAPDTRSVEVAIPVEVFTKTGALLCLSRDISVAWLRIGPTSAQLSLDEALALRFELDGEGVEVEARVACLELNGMVLLEFTGFLREGARDVLEGFIDRRSDEAVMADPVVEVCDEAIESDLFVMVTCRGLTHLGQAQELSMTGLRMTHPDAHLELHQRVELELELCSEPLKMEAQITSFELDGTLELAFLEVSPRAERLLLRHISCDDDVADAPSLEPKVFQHEPEVSRPAPPVEVVAPRMTRAPASDRRGWSRSRVFALVVLIALFGFVWVLLSTSQELTRAPEGSSGSVSLTILDEAEEEPCVSSAAALQVLDIDAVSSHAGLMMGAEAEVEEARRTLFDDVRDEDASTSVTTEDRRNKDEARVADDDGGRPPEFEDDLPTVILSPKPGAFSQVSVYTD